MESCIHLSPANTPPHILMPCFFKLFCSLTYPAPVLLPHQDLQSNCPIFLSHLADPSCFQFIAFSYKTLCQATLESTQKTYWDPWSPNSAGPSGSPENLASSFSFLFQTFFILFCTSNLNIAWFTFSTRDSGLIYRVNKSQRVRTPTSHLQIYKHSSLSLSPWERCPIVKVSRPILCFLLFHLDPFIIPLSLLHFKPLTLVGPSPLQHFCLLTYSPAL